MSIGCCIYFAPEDRCWLASPDFLRGVAAFFEAKVFESVRVYRSATVPPGGESDNDVAAGRGLEVYHLAVEAAIALQHPGHGGTTVLQFGPSGALIRMGEAVIHDLPQELSEGFYPIEAAIHHGRWEVYDQGGVFIDAGMCCVALSNDLGYPIEMKDYLAGYLRVREIVRFQRCLEELSTQPWHALIELT